MTVHGTHICPNCGHRSEVKVIFTRPKTQTANRRGLMQSVADFRPSTNPLVSFWQVVIQGRQYQRNDNNRFVTVRTEHKPSPYETLLNTLDLSLKEDDLRALARVYLDMGLTWSRRNSTEVGRLSQPKHNKATGEFAALEFIVKEGNRYQLTEAGIQFLEHFRVHPSAFDAYTRQ